MFEPNSSWAPPCVFPYISDMEIAIDLETKDPNLRSSGPGWHRKDGEVIGIAITSRSFTGYFPIAHLHGDNLDRRLVISWVREVTSDPSKTYIFHNAPYDLGWLKTLNIDVKGKIVDTQIMESLINEERPDGYSLDALSRTYLKRPKDEVLLNEAASAYGVNPKSEMWKLPARFVGPYAEMDTKNTFEVYEKQKPEIESQSLIHVAALETRVTPIIVEMNWRGIPVDVLKAEELNEEWLKEEEALKKSLGGVDIWSTEQLARLLDREGIAYPKTEKGNASITKNWLQQNGKNHRTLEQIQRVREFNRIRNVFVYEAIVKGNINGRVHPNFLQVAVGDGGTRTGRFACKNPNIQQIPKRSGVVDAKRVRGLYTAEGDYQWASLDYAAQEPRMQIHYGIIKKIPSADEARHFIETSGKKIYSFIEEKCPEVDYNQAKDIVLGRSYGMGKATMAENIGVDIDECEQILESFDSFCPFIRELAEATSDKAQRTGFIRTLYGRRRRFNFWKPEGEFDALPVYGRRNAEERYSRKNLERAYTHKAFNALIQGSCADQTKQAMVNMYEAGYLPYSQVHDEVNVPVKNEKEAKECQEIMEHAIELKIKTVADLDIGDHW